MLELYNKHGNDYLITGIRKNRKDNFIKKEYPQELQIIFAQ